MAAKGLICTRGVRGAITVEEDNQENLEKATVELLTKIFEANKIEIEEISHVIFSLTKDLKSAFPAKFARRNFKFQFVPMLCVNELDIEPSLKRCLRILIVWNTDKKQEEIKHIYLGGAKILRSDLATE